MGLKQLVSRVGDDAMREEGMTIFMEKTIAILCDFICFPGSEHSHFFYFLVFTFFLFPVFNSALMKCRGYGSVQMKLKNE